MTTKSDNGTAFIFNLRQNDVLDPKKTSKLNDTAHAIYNNGLFGPAFGSYYCDILIGSNIEASNFADFGISYTLPRGYIVQTDDARSY
jgi:hypothetical protein